ncbi:nitrate reductase molybdenum cofactor assembly chaperone [Bacillus andreraoultii]|uniref:nitrate reductase molybdenum cofactor assembly chaperone n=1 Tax=Bacillus andreraoultii TaxID=1499685 RepID=UPI00053997A4|nr:nitrate reductase molybdenum cofactor assembly chaperone [Bacillus andreraoultii]
MTNYQETKSVVYQLISILFQYPDNELHSILPELQKEIQNLNDPELKKILIQFIDVLNNTPTEQLINHYIEQFDFGRTTNLYVTYFNSGEARERGIELLKLKEYYKEHGFDITDKELPDYLPLMLEFCGNVSTPVSNDLLQNHYHSILEMQNKFHEANSFYGYLLDALLLCMERNGLSRQEQDESTS